MSQPKPDYSWAEYLDYMEGGGSDVLTLPAGKPVPAAEKKRGQLVLGLLLATGVALLSLALGRLPIWPFTVTANQRILHPVEPVMIAIILGMLLSNLWTLPKSLQPGLKFSVKKLLPLGIVLLGARLHFGDLLKVGLTGLILSGLETIVALSLLLLLARWMHLPQKLGMLLGVGTAICGGTAIVATAPVIEADEKDVAFSVATVTLLGLIAMFALPLIGHALDLSAAQFGMWAGLAIHQTPQVVAAGYAFSPDGLEYSPVAGDTATIVKLARVCLLAPVVFAIGLLYARDRTGAGAAGGPGRINYLHLFPMFVLGFLGMALLRTLGWLPEMTLRFADGALTSERVYNLSVGGLAEEISRFCILLSMAGVGLETKFAAMRQTGWKPLLASFIAVVAVAALVLVLIKSLAI